MCFPPPRKTSRIPRTLHLPNGASHEELNHSPNHTNRCAGIDDPVIVSCCPRPSEEALEQSGRRLANTGTSFAPVRFIGEMRELTVEGVRSDDLTETDWMNGLEWAGEVSFKQAPCREAGDQGILLDGLANLTVFRKRGQWTQWVDFEPEPVQVQKVKANWQLASPTRHLASPWQHSRSRRLCQRWCEIEKTAA